MRSRADVWVWAKMSALNWFRNRCTLVLAGLVSSLPLYLRMLNPRKSKPSLMWLIWVLVGDRVKPLSYRKAWSRGVTSFSRKARSAAVMMKSSA